MPMNRFTPRSGIPMSRVLLIAIAIVTVPAPTVGQDTRQGTGDEIDADALMRDLSVLAHDSMAGRMVGSQGSDASRRWIVGRLVDLGVPVDSQVFEVERRGEVRRGVNVYALLPGSTRDARAPFVMSAHYDHVGVRDGEIYNGADDNASGTAALLAFAEALTRRPLERPAVLAFFDAEEGGLSGARAFVESAGARIREEVALNVNLDMVSRSEEELWVAGTYQNPALRPVVEAVEPAEGVVLRFGHDGPAWTGSDNWSAASDHAPFDRAGVPFLYFGVEDHPDYHRPTDDVDRVDSAWFRSSVETILRVARALDEAAEAVETARSERGGR